jgi:DNA-binding NtrC family response regulator
MTLENIPSLLLVEDDPTLALTYESYLKSESYNVTTIDTGKAALAYLAAFRPIAVILDIHLPDMHDFQILRHIRKAYPQTPVVVITADSNPEMALGAIKEGAFDFIAKPFTKARLIVTLHKVLEHVALEREVREWRQCLGSSPYQGFIGNAPSMLAVYRIIDSVAASKASVFIIGESGTGKELAAQAIHKISPRHLAPFVAINCGAIPEHLMESTLFGHIKGAFTGAVADSLGATRKADGGTLFLDEIGELAPDLQVKLLRFLQSGEATPVGSDTTYHLDVRIIAATNRAPQEEIENGRLREDLFYRLHVVPLEMPPLRDRDEDILLLAEHFLLKLNAEEERDFVAFDPEVLSLFRKYDWPGNVRELENLIRSLVVLYRGPYVTPDMLPEKFLEKTRAPESSTSGNNTGSSGDGPKPTDDVVKPLWLSEKESILKALAFTNQDVAKAAALLEVSPSTLYRKLQAWNASDRKDGK